MTSTPSFVAAMTLEQQLAAVSERLERERQARQQFVIRAGVDYEALVTTYRTLRALSEIDLSDLLVPPGFNLLPDGEVGSANSYTQEWQLWARLASLKDDVEYLYGALLHASEELKGAGHWDAEQASA